MRDERSLATDRRYADEPSRRSESGGAAPPPPPGVQVGEAHCPPASEPRDLLDSDIPSLLHELLRDPWPGQDAPGTARQVGKYLLQEIIGSGGSSDVYLAVVVDEDGPTDPVAAPQGVALKLFSRLAVTPDELDRFRAEVRILASIQHPGVARYLDCGVTDDGLPYLVMELVDGQPIDQFCDDRKLSIRERVELLLQVCSAVVAVHANRVLHRDLSPRNILVTPDRVAKLVDFGIAKQVAVTTQGANHGLRTETGVILGTPACLSPEQADGRSRDIDARTDVHALGVILYRLLTGHMPFKGVHLGDLLHAIRHNDPVPPTRLTAGIPRPLEIICQKCLRKEPDRRYPSVAAISDDLRRWLEGRAIKARPVSAAGRACRWLRRRPLVAILLGALITTVLSSLVVLAFLLRRAETERASAVAAQRQAEVNQRQAEVNQRQAEANQRVAIDMITEMFALSGRAIGMSGASADTEIIQHYTKLRKSLLELGPPLELNTVGLALLGAIDHELGNRLRNCGDVAEGRARLTESMNLARRGQEIDRTDQLFTSMLVQEEHQLGFDMLTAREISDGLRMLDQMVADSAALKEEPGRIGALARACDCRRNAAQYLSAQGHPDEARQILDADLGSFRKLNPADAARPMLRFRQGLTLAALGRWDEASRFLSSRRKASVADPLLRDHVDGLLMELVTREVEDSLKDPNGLWRTDNRIDAETWAGTIMRSLQARCAELGSQGPPIPETALRWATITYQAVVVLRSEGKLAEVERLTDRTCAFEHLVLTKYPEHPCAHLAMCAGYVQRAKNAWKHNDLKAVDRNWQLALDEARRALALDPKNQQARYEVDDLSRRLKALRLPE